MRPALPEKLGSEFWFSLFMVVLCFFIAFVGFYRGFGYPASVGGLLGISYVYRLLKHVQNVRLARRLKQDPEIARLYHAQNH